jgi:hypothetical protein
MKIILSIALMLFATVAISQDSEKLIELKEAVQPTLDAAYQLNAGQTFDSRFNYKVTYDKNGEESDRMIYSVHPNTFKFSELNIALATEKYTWNDREALYQDGSETGMSSIVIILKNEAGKFAVTHRMLGGIPLDKAGLEKVLSQINWELLEK